MNAKCDLIEIQRYNKITEKMKGQKVTKIDYMYNPLAHLPQRGDHPLNEL